MLRLGIVAGWGTLPVEVAREAARRNLSTVVCAIDPEVHPDLGRIAGELTRVDLGQMGAMLSALKERSVDAVLFAGKVRKERLFCGLDPDTRLKALLARLPELSDETVMQGVAGEFESEGIKVLSQAEFLGGLLARAGILAGQPLTEQAKRDADFGFDAAKTTASCGIGQAVVVKDRVVVAVEAVEGTDEAIRRGVRLGGPGTTVVKVSRPNQDTRFDVPTIGLSTLETMRQGECSCLVVEADKTFIVERDLVLESAAAAGITIMAMGEASKS